MVTSSLKKQLKQEQLQLFMKSLLSKKKKVLYMCRWKIVQQRRSYCS